MQSHLLLVQLRAQRPFLVSGEEGKSGSKLQPRSESGHFALFVGLVSSTRPSY